MASSGGSKPKTQGNLVPKYVAQKTAGTEIVFGPPRMAQVNSARQDPSARSRRGGNKQRVGKKEGKATKKWKGKRFTVIPLPPRPSDLWPLQQLACFLALFPCLIITLFPHWSPTNSYISS
jgi:hypothetical protein